MIAAPAASGDKAGRLLDGYRTALHELTVDQLKNLCAANYLMKKGNKDEIVERLVKARYAHIIYKYYQATELKSLFYDTNNLSQSKPLIPDG